jgi:hypothetical protein
MKSTYVLGLTVAFALYCAPAFAQHGHGAGGPGGMNGMGNSSHGNGDTHGMSDAHGMSNDGGSAAASHGKTMDQLLTQNTKLSDKISTLTGEPAQQACTGFKNLGQCVAAAHVSKNLGISFACLKSDMTGTAPSTDSSCPAGTGSKAMSLGKSIQTLSPKTDSKTEEKKGQEQAIQDLTDATKTS